MSVVKVIELLAESEQSWEDAARKAVAEAAKSVRGIRSIHIFSVHILRRGRPRWMTTGSVPIGSMRRSLSSSRTPRAEWAGRAATGAVPPHPRPGLRRDPARPIAAWGLHPIDVGAVR
jgi:flavin-binding protein dodecin